MVEIKFLQARDYRIGRRDPATGKPCVIKNIVIHTAEIGESVEGAEALMRACARGRPPKADGSANLASWHYSVDSNSITQSVKEPDTAFHAPGLSHRSIGIEHAGRARQTRAEWFDPFSEAMLRLSANLVASIASRYSIPIVKVSAFELGRGDPGICGHKDVSDAFRKSTHWDPGPEFPWVEYLSLVKDVFTRDTNPEPFPQPTHPIVAIGHPDKAAVRLLQERLVYHGFAIKVDEAFGPRTRAAVIEFQKRELIIPANGIVDHETWMELLR
jgi:N-acetyl-anhydromuramyl-L-alanine amidase AmpD